MSEPDFKAILRRNLTEARAREREAWAAYLVPGNDAGERTATWGRTKGAVWALEALAVDLGILAEIERDVTPRHDWDDLDMCKACFVPSSSRRAGAPCQGVSRKAT